MISLPCKLNDWKRLKLWLPSHVELCVCHIFNPTKYVLCDHTHSQSLNEFILDKDFFLETSCRCQTIFWYAEWGGHFLMDDVLSLRHQLTAQQIAIQQQLLQVQQQHLLTLQRQGLLSVLPTSPITAPGMLCYCIAVKWNKILSSTVVGVHVCYFKQGASNKLETEGILDFDFSLYL